MNNKLEKYLPYFRAYLTKEQIIKLPENVIVSAKTIETDEYNDYDYLGNGEFCIAGLEYITKKDIVHLADETKFTNVKIFGGTEEALEAIPALFPDDYMEKYNENMTKAEKELAVVKRVNKAFSNIPAEKKEEAIRYLESLAA